MELSEASDSDSDGDTVSVKAKYVFDGPAMPQPAFVDADGGISNDALDMQQGGLWSVSARALTTAQIAAHVKALTCTPRQVMRCTKPVSFPVGFLRHGRLFMPPWYARMAFPKAVAKTSVLTRGKAMRPEVQFCGTLFEHPPQLAARFRYASWLRENIPCTSCILSLPCGYGKTVLFLNIACTLRRVTLILTHKLPLVDQWIEEARAFCKHARVGYITAQRTRTQNVDIIVASVQSLRAHIERGEPYLSWLFADVGLVCLDEGHHAVASTFSSVLSAVPALYRIVLTATPRRKDGLLPQLQWVAGPVIFRAFRQCNEVHVVALEYKSAAHTELRSRFGLKSAEMVNNLTTDAVRTQLALAVIEQLVPQQRRILVVTPRVEHVKEITDAVRAMLKPREAELRRKVKLFVPDARPRKKSKLSKRQCRAYSRRGMMRNVLLKTPLSAALIACLSSKAMITTDDLMHEWEDSGPHGNHFDFTAETAAAVIQGMNTLDRNLAYEATVVVTTTQMMEEGISYKQWDTLLDLDNVSDAEQVVGRILRACVSKRVPLVVDMWINVSMFAGLFWKRWRYYSAERFSRRRIAAANAAELPGRDFWAAFDYNASNTV